MKKMYIAPETMATEIIHCLPIAASGDLEYQEDGTITGDLNDGTATGGGLVKGNSGSIWDNEGWDE